MQAALARLPGDVADAATSASSPSLPSPSSPPPDVASAIVGAAATEARSNLRYGVWLTLCIATGGVGIIDLFSVEPAVGADAASLGLAAWLGWAAARERAVLDAAASAAAARAAAAAAERGNGGDGA
jgi:hypothetical protein